MSMTAFLRDHPAPDEPAIREALSGHLCRCTGYQNIVKAVQLAVSRRTSP
jgi:carbon-monoxide dehydrogenase small subunit